MIYTVKSTDSTLIEELMDLESKKHYNEKRLFKMKKTNLAEGTTICNSTLSISCFFSLL